MNFPASFIPQVTPAVSSKQELCVESHSCFYGVSDGTDIPRSSEVDKHPCVHLHLCGWQVHGPFQGVLAPVAPRCMSLGTFGVGRPILTIQCILMAL